VKIDGKSVTKLDSEKTGHLLSMVKVGSFVDLEFLRPAEDANYIIPVSFLARESELDEKYQPEFKYFDSKICDFDQVEVELRKGVEKFKRHKKIYMKHKQSMDLKMF